MRKKLITITLMFALAMFAEAQSFVHFWHQDGYESGLPIDGPGFTLHFFEMADAFAGPISQSSPMVIDMPDIGGVLTLRCTKGRAYFGRVSGEDGLVLDSDVEVEVELSLSSTMFDMKPELFSSISVDGSTGLIGSYPDFLNPSIVRLSYAGGSAGGFKAIGFSTANPVPEATSISLLGVAGSLLLVRRRR